MYLRVKKVDIDNGDDFYILLHTTDALREGIYDGDLVELSMGDITLNVRASVTDSAIEIGSVGIYRDIWMKFEIVNDTMSLVQLITPSESIEHIKKKMLGNKLNKDQLYQIMQDMGSRKIGMTEVAYFMSTFFNPGFDEEEVQWMTEGMANSGLKLDFSHLGKGGIVADKHSIGGVAGKAITPVIVPILACGGLIVPNTSTRAITTPAGTSDILEVVMPVSLNNDEIMDTVKKTGACMVWGGALDLAPADDVLIHVERVIHLESYQKLLVSIVAKKIAMGITHVIIDIPHGKGTKVQNIEDVDMIKKGFQKLFNAVGIKSVFYVRNIKNLDGNGIGPNLEMIEVLKLLSQDSERSIDLENTIVDMAGQLFELCDVAPKGRGEALARSFLESGDAKKKFWEIAFAQGATKEVEIGDIKLGEYTHDVLSEKDGTIKMWNNREVRKVTKYLGTPVVKEAGIYVHKVAGDKIKKGDKLITLYTSSQSRIDNALTVLDLEKILEIS
ncbi:MAG TPA: thymidine phosphorylase [Candidatus Dojkabacteria bacterium]|nr:thymidine phosphorylase [Candidatus Dojkabacteria bacterium]